MIPKYILILFSSVTVFVITSYIICREWLRNHLYPLKSCNSDETCVSFCCDFKNSCLNHEYLRDLTISLSENIDRNFKILKRIPCEELFPNDEWSFEKNGFVNDEENHTHSWNEYCLQINDQTNETQMLTCPPIHLIESAKSTYPYLMLSSVPFFIITLIIYAFIKELRTNHGKCVMGYILSLTVMYTSLSFVNLFNFDMMEHHILTCKSLGYIVLMSILMCFFWLNVMCYDIFRSIRSFKRPYDSMKKYICYCVYAFGIPFFLGFIVILLNEFEIVPVEWRTNIGNHSCMISEPIFGGTDEEKKHSNRAQWIYMYGPIMLILLINFGFYSLTAYTIYKVQKDVKRFSKRERSKHAKKETARFALYVRFFMMMGLPWAIEVSSWIFGETFFLYLASIINCLQGFIILVMFVLHKKVFKLIMARFRPYPNTQATMYNKANSARNSTVLHRPLKVNLSNTTNSHTSTHGMNMNEQTSF
ncbi:hypothetical protein PVAND_015439 [Polypedilum vanderplanki]|uniref:G-protein coupled receptors family 2 profile 2 domain-containing protein n=1 Tax=Polypedilum vanderplanki TaxID=319348 RepID=A0A9J6BD47_POLVA|nr:hypothetical protein PVAND_015439 [Polypedilum vanderplanki]